MSLSASPAPIDPGTNGDEPRAHALASARAADATPRSPADDAAALERLMRDHRTPVVRYAMRVCLSPQDAEDATQETLLALARHIGALREVAALTSWLFTVVRRHCLRLGRRSVRRMLNLDDVPEPAALSPSAEDAFVDDQLREHLAAVVATLEPGQREVLLRRDVRGQSAAEVAAALGLSVQAVKSRLHRARQEVRERLLRRLRA